MGGKRKPARASSGPVIVVDDDDAVRQTVDVVLRSLGLRVTGFASAEAFLRSKQPQKAACAIVDLNLPGMNGLELVQRLYAKGVRIPIIMITGDRDENTRPRALAAGATAFLTKPFDPDALCAAVQPAVAQR